MKKGTLRTEKADAPANLCCVWSEPNAPDGTPEMKCRLADVEQFRFADDDED